MYFDRNLNAKHKLFDFFQIRIKIKMSKKGEHKIEGYFDYVVPPLEGFWWQDGIVGIDYRHKESFNWISVIRLPDFVTQKDFECARDSVQKKKKLDCYSAQFFSLEEGDCVQVMHLGSYDEEPATIKMMDEYALLKGYEVDFSASRLHHEIYLSDPRKVSGEKLRTVIRHPVRKIK